MTTREAIHIIGSLTSSVTEECSALVFARQALEIIATIEERMPPGVMLDVSRDPKQGWVVTVGPLGRARQRWSREELIDALLAATIAFDDS